jgi:hypothetical protein
MQQLFKDYQKNIFYLCLGFSIFCFYGAIFVPRSSAAALAGPTITGVQGTVSDGLSISINGSGFGANGPNIKVFDDFEKGTNNAPISTQPNSAAVGQWDRSQDTVVYSSEFAHSGSLSFKSDWSSDNYKEGGRLIGININDVEVYFSWWQYLPTTDHVPGDGGPGAGGPNWKYYWLWGGTPPTGKWPYDDYVTVLLTGSLPPCSVGCVAFVALDDPRTPARWGSGSVDDFSTYSTFIKGRWLRQDYYLKAGQTTGAAKMWELTPSGMSQKINANNVYTVYPNEVWTRWNIPGYGRATYNSRTYYDDVYFATGPGAQARVEIGNAQTYKNCTNLAIMTPTSWSDTTIVATVKLGSFKIGDPVYLYVVDANGVVSTQGFPVIIGHKVPLPPVLH